MPHIRRSSRIQYNKTSIKKEISTPKTTSPANPKRKSKEKIETKSDPDICFAGQQKHPPIRRYTVVEWAKCGNRSVVACRMCMYNS